MTEESKIIEAIRHELNAALTDLDGLASLPAYNPAIGHGPWRPMSKVPMDGTPVLLRGDAVATWPPSAVKRGDKDERIVCWAYMESGIWQTGWLGARMVPDAWMPTPTYDHEAPEGHSIDPARLIPELSEVREEVNRFNATFADTSVFREAYRDAIRIIETLEALIIGFYRANSGLSQALDGVYWGWQGEGSDHLETLTCPVYIHPDDMIAALRDAERRGDSKGREAMLESSPDRDHLVLSLRRDLGYARNAIDQMKIEVRRYADQAEAANKAKDAAIHRHADITSDLHKATERCDRLMTGLRRQVESQAKTIDELAEANQDLTEQCDKHRQAFDSAKEEGREEANARMVQWADHIDRRINDIEKAGRYDGRSNERKELNQQCANILRHGAPEAPEDKASS